MSRASNLFALLKVDDDDESDTVNSSATHKTKAQQNQQSSQKKKNKKKKKVSQNAENDELRNLAFNKGGLSKPRTTSTSSAGGDASQAQWDEWKKLDEEYTADNFEKDLETALLQSKLEHEHVQEVKKELEAQGIVLTEDGKQKKKKNKSKGTMSLNEFQQLEKIDTVKSKREDDESDEEEIPSVPQPVAQVSNPDPKFFDNVETDVHKIIQKEKIQEEYQKNFVLENVRIQKFKDDLEKRDEEIEKLKESHKDMEKELKQVKKRNQQLCVILSQGEMKDKTKILMELEELRQMREELTEEVTSLTTELEKERSKVHQLQSELTKTKGGKHNK